MLQELSCHPDLFLLSSARNNMQLGITLRVPEASGVIFRGLEVFRPLARRPFSPNLHCWQRSCLFHPVSGLSRFSPASDVINAGREDPAVARLMNSTAASLSSPRYPGSGCQIKTAGEKSACVWVGGRVVIVASTLWSIINSVWLLGWKLRSCLRNESGWWS